MLILIEDTERGLDVAQGLWGAFNGCLYIEDNCMESTSVAHVISQCAKSGVVLIIVAEDILRFKKKNQHAFCIECDGNGFVTGPNFIRFKKDFPRDRVVGELIKIFKQMKLL